MPQFAYRHPLPNEREAIWDLVAEAFDLDRLRAPELRRHLTDEPCYADGRTVVAADQGGQLVGHLAAAEWEVSLGPVWLPIGRLGTVCVAPRARRLGVGRELVRRAGELLADRAAVFLNPAHDAYVIRFYEELGFVAAQRSVSYLTIDTGRLPEPRGCRLRAPGPSDARALDALYREHYGRRPGTLDHTDEWWQRRIGGRPLLWAAGPIELRLAERHGPPLAYLMSWHDDVPQVLDWAGEPEAALALLAAWAAGHGDRVGLHVAADDPLRPLLEPFDPRDESPAPRPLMVKAHNLDRLEPVLAELLASRGASLAAHGDLAEVRLGAVRLRCAWSRLLALCYDGGALAEWANSGWVEITPATEALTMQRALPARRATRRPADGF